MTTGAAITTPAIAASSFRTSTFAPALRTEVSLASTRNGAGTTLTGRLSAAQSASVAGQPVVLQVRDGNNWHTVATKPLNANGSAVFAVRPSVTTTYRLNYFGGATFSASTSGSVTVTVTTASRRTTTTAATNATTTTRSNSASVALPGSTGKRAQVVAAAKAQSGKPYAYGAAGPRAFDCSGLTMYAFRTVGISLPHKANSQKGYGTAVSRAQAQPGDLVIYLDGGYGYHAGIYAGNGYMYDAPTTGQTVGLHKLYGGSMIFRRLV
jgi:cell wall-associated NlpC family hydrolase